MPRTRITRAAAAIAALAATAIVLSACTKVEEGATPESSFPEQDIRLIIQANPGGGSDLSSRALATELERILGVSVIPENMPGAAGALAMEYVGLAESRRIRHRLRTRRDRDAQHDAGRERAARELRSARADHARARRHQRRREQRDRDRSKTSSSRRRAVPSPSRTPVPARSGRRRRSVSASATDAEFTPVPYDGGATAVAAAASGETVASVSGSARHSHRARRCASSPSCTTSATPTLEDVPTVEEALGDEVLFGGWGGIYAPKGLPDDVRETLEAAVKEAVESDSYQKFQKDSGNLVVYRDSAEWTTFVDEQFVLFQDLLG